MSHENQLVNLASLNTQYSPLITFILCCARQGMGVILKEENAHDVEIVDYHKG
jgi:hypothetical protein